MDPVQLTLKNSLKSLDFLGSYLHYITSTIEDEQVLEKLYQEFDSSGSGKVSYEDFKRINDLVSERYTD
jgi:Ca2+-binding EF-hand superfamily protein